MKDITIIAALMGCALACSRESREKPMNPDTIVSQLGLSLPSGTLVLGASATNDREGLIRAKLEMPATQVASFLANANIPALEEAGPDLLGPDEGFWDPHRAGPLRSGDTELPGARFLLVAIDGGHEDKAVVYLMVHGT